MPEATYREAMQEARELFLESGIADADADAWYLMEYVTGMGRTEFLLKRQETMDAPKREEYRRLARLRAGHIPLQHLTGTQDFMGFSFRVNGDVLIPRQDTEILAEHAVRYLRDGMDVLDLCTGSGCLAVSLKKLCPGIRVTGSDLSEKALAVARENGRILETEVTWVKSDLFADIDGQFDLIVSNPPYIRTDVIGGLSEEVRLHEPHMALDGGGDGLYFYRKIIGQAADFLKPGGFLMFEIGYDQGEAVAKLMETARFGQVSVLRDLAGLERVVSGSYGSHSGSPANRAVVRGPQGSGR